MLNVSLDNHSAFDDTEFPICTWSNQGIAAVFKYHPENNCHGVVLHNLQLIVNIKWAKDYVNYYFEPLDEKFFQVIWYIIKNLAFVLKSKKSQNATF